MVITFFLRTFAVEIKCENDMDSKVNLNEEYSVEIKKEFVELGGNVLYLYDSSKKFIGVLTTELQLLDVLVQVARNSLTGYYVKVNNERKIEILPDGRLTENIPSVYDDMLKELVGF